VRYVGRAWKLPQKKKSIFVPKMISLCAFYAVFNRQKTRTVNRSLGTRNLRFSRETKLTKTLQKLSKKVMVRPKGGGGRTVAP